MDFAIHSSGLRVPRTQTDVSAAIDWRPKTLKLWTEALPLANVPGSAHQVLERLRRLNSVCLPPKERAKLMNLLQAPCDYLSAALRQQVIHQSMPLSARYMHLANHCHGILTELAYAYKHIIVDQLAAQRPDPARLRQAICQAMRALGQTLLLAYELYAPEPPRSWFELHRLYLLAEQHQLLNTRTHGPWAIFRNPPASDIAAAYKQSLLLALCNPYRLRRGEIGKIHRFLQTHAHLASLQPWAAAERPEFACHLLSTKGPCHILPNETVDQRYSRILNVQAVLEALRHPTNTKDLPANLVQTLLSGFGRRRQRMLLRRQGQLSLDVSVGLSNTHHLLKRLRERSRPLSPTPADPAIFVTQETAAAESAPNREPVARQDGPANATPATTEYDEAGPEEIIIHAPAPPATTRHPTQTWRTIDQSKGGCCIVRPNSSTPLQIGELVGLHPRHQSQSWHIGVIRWMQLAKGLGVKLGIQILAPGASAITARPCNDVEADPRETQSSSAGLVLPACANRRQPPTLLTPSLLFRTGDTLMLEQNGKRVRVKLIKQLETTGDFTRYQYRRVDQTDKPPVKAAVRRSAL